jgi:hypothetical protein
MTEDARGWLGGKRPMPQSSHLGYGHLQRATSDNEKALDSTASRAICVVLSVHQPASSRAAWCLKVITEAEHDNVFILARQIENVEFAVGIGSTDTHLSELAFVEIVP